MGRAKWPLEALGLKNTAYENEKWDTLPVSGRFIKDERVKDASNKLLLVLLYSISVIAATYLIWIVLDGLHFTIPKQVDVSSIFLSVAGVVLAWLTLGSTIDAYRAAHPPKLTINQFRCNISKDGLPLVEFFILNNGDSRAEIINYQLTFYCGDGWHPANAPSLPAIGRFLVHDLQAKQSLKTEPRIAEILSMAEREEVLSGRQKARVFGILQCDDSRGVVHRVRFLRRYDAGDNRWHPVEDFDI